MIANWPKELIDLKENLETFELNVICGVYFIISGNDIVYIGSSVDVHSRIKVHFNNIHPITKVCVLPLNNIKIAREKEVVLIKHFEPEFNALNNPKNKKPEINIEKNRDKLRRLLSESTIDSIDKVLGTIYAREAAIIRHRYDVAGTGFMTLKGLSLIYRLTHERIRQVQVKAERRLLHPTRLKQFIKKVD